MGRRAKAVQADAARLRPGRRIGAPANQPRAQQRRCLQIAVALGQRKHMARIGQRMLGIAALDLPAGEAGVRTEVLAAGPTISWPGTRACAGNASSPSSRCRSVRQTPQQAT